MMVIGAFLSPRRWSVSVTAAIWISAGILLVGGVGLLLIAIFPESPLSEARLTSFKAKIPRIIKPTVPRQRMAVIKPVTNEVRGGRLSKNEFFGEFGSIKKCFNKVLIILTHFFKKQEGAKMMKVSYNVKIYFKTVMASILGKYISEFLEYL